MRANPLTTDLNISIRSENLRVRCESRSKTMNMTVLDDTYTGFCMWKLCRIRGRGSP